MGRYVMGIYVSSIRCRFIGECTCVAVGKTYGYIVIATFIFTEPYLDVLTASNIESYLEHRIVHIFVYHFFYDLSEVLGLTLDIRL